MDSNLNRFSTARTKEHESSSVSAPEMPDNQNSSLRTMYEIKKYYPHFDGIIYEGEEEIFIDDVVNVVPSNNANIRNHNQDLHADDRGPELSKPDSIPIWVQGEKRWVSGVNEHTTCGDLVNVLLSGLDEGNKTVKVLGKGPCYAITMKWRRSEHIISNETRILEIWSAWKKAKKEVNLSLREVDNHPLPPPAVQVVEKDSGMSSPVGSSSSAIIRRRKHRASKSTTAWLTEAQTIHPKSHRHTIEKLMKLILEQGETIQQQLAKLRDRELQIARIEEERHKVREKELGKNYLLETYLNGLHEAEDRDLTTVNSDSGVQTEGVLQSSTTTTQPSSSTAAIDSDYISNPSPEGKKDSPSPVVNEDDEDDDEDEGNDGADNDDNEPRTADESKGNKDTSAQIEWMEKLFLINKRLQHEEELLVRLGAKIKKYENKNPLLDENQIIDALIKLNGTIQANETEMKQIETDLADSNDKLKDKLNVLEELSKEFMYESTPASLSKDLLNLSQYIQKPTSYEFNEMNEKFNFENVNNQKYQFSKETSPLVSGDRDREGEADVMEIPLNQVIKISQAPIVNCKNVISNPIPTQQQHQNHQHQHQLAPFNSNVVVNGNVNQNNVIQCNNDDNGRDNMYATVSRNRTCLMGKFGPKKVMIMGNRTAGNELQFESNSDTGLSSLGEDITQMGTLV